MRNSQVIGRNKNVLCRVVSAPCGAHPMFYGWDFEVWSAHCGVWGDESLMPLIMRRNLYKPAALLGLAFTSPV